MAVPQMSALNIPVTPENYAIWYQYYSETNLDLKRAIDGLLANKVEFTASVNQGLYNNFINDQSPEVIENVQIETQILINSLVSKINDLSSGTSNFSSSLSSFSDELQSDPSPQSFNKMLVNVSAEVEKVLFHNELMRADIDTLGSELVTLKEEMVNLSKVAMTDELTSLNNRRAYEIFALEQVNLFTQNHVPCCLLMVDIDHFKNFNDTYGHLIGDKVLAFVAFALKQTVKGNDFVARYGGEEFVVLLPNTDLEDALTVAEHIRERIAGKQLTIGKEKKQQLGNITVSVGAACIQPGDDVETLLTRADDMLYQAKSNGRNCVKG
ncbi:GGDEF domain-containing protein [Shewanella donghaensis]|uniref:GGDEF domain-containing protein n=1 Tax=Shewanella donghaensis TaxID=238836 RepID=UPI001183F653|nr:GGDEF domain-containing protein [Shewanella donghaensis]